MLNTFRKRLNCEADDDCVCESDQPCKVLCLTDAQTEQFLGDRLVTGSYTSLTYPGFGSVRFTVEDSGYWNFVFVYDEGVFPTRLVANLR